MREEKRDRKNSWVQYGGPAAIGKGEWRVQRVLVWAFGILCLFCALVSLGSVFVWKNYGGPIPSGYWALFMCLAIGGIAWAAWRFGARIKPWQGLGVVFAVALALRLFATFTMEVEPYGDFRFYREVALALSSGDTGPISGDYFSLRFPFLQAYILFQSAIIKLFGPSQVPQQVIGCFFSAGIAALAFLIGGKKDRRLGLLAGLLYALYPSSVAQSGVLTGQHIGVFFLYLALYLIIAMKGSWWQRALGALGIGLLMGVAQLFRPVALPVLAGIAVFALYKVCFQGKGRGAKGLFPLALVVALLAGYAGVTMGFDLYAYEKGYRGEPFVDSDMYTKFALGLRPEVAQSDLPLREQLGEASNSEKKEIVIEYLRHYLRHPLDFIVRQGAYLTSQWSIPDAGFYWRYGGEMARLYEAADSDAEAEAAYRRLATYEKWYYGAESAFHSAVMAFAFVAFLGLRKKPCAQGILLLLLVILMYVGVHLFIEFQPRYRYFGMPVFILFGAGGLLEAAARIRNSKQHGTVL